MYVKRTCAKSEGTLTDFYLIKTNGSELLYDASIKATKQDAAGISAEVIDILKKKGMDRIVATKVGIALEEAAVNLAQINRKPVDMDVRIPEDGEGIMLFLRDNGVPFNLLEYTPGEQTDAETRGDGIAVLKALASRIDYSLVLAINQTIIAFNHPAG